MIPLSNALPGTQLNSVWVEGLVDSEPQGLPVYPTIYRFVVRTLHKDVEDLSSLAIEAPEYAFDGTKDQVRRGRTVRIIGRLHQHRWRDPRGQAHEEVKIISELVEPLQTK